MNDAAKPLEIVWYPPTDLVPYAKNAKVHSNEQIDKIAGQISAFGFDQPIVIDENKVIIKGHGRREASIRLGLPKVPVIVSTLDEYQAMAARIADNKVAEAPYDNELLKFDLGTLDLQNFNMELTGMDNVALNALLNPEELEREQGKGIEDFSETHETTDIRQIILIMDESEYEPMLMGLMKVQEREGLDNNVEAVKFLLERYASSDSAQNPTE